MFQDRAQAADRLWRRLQDYRNAPGVVILALPRGGAPIGRILADQLNAPFDIFLAKKIGAPDQPELALGAVAEGDIRFIDDSIVQQLRLTDADVERAAKAAQTELEHRRKLYRNGIQPPDLQGCTAILVDDGAATGATMSAAIRAVRLRGVAQVVVALPVAPPNTFRRLQGEADGVICLETHEPFFSVGTWYHDFHQVSDEEVARALGRDLHHSVGD